MVQFLTFPLTTAKNNGLQDKYDTPAPPFPKIFSPATSTQI